ncbi:MAG: hypothetical protein II124_01270 [Clostridia bacterium]|nr:hypothetical protein [Clostridia bacterium]
MANKLSEQKCPACGAPLRFDPESGKSVCDWCGRSYDIPTETDETLAEGGEAPLEELSVYNCKSCGAEIVTDAVSASVQCPYCGNNIVLTEKVTGGLRPDGVIPFKIDKKSLPAAVREFYKDRKLLPKKFFADSSIEDVVGVYVPFWLYNCTMQGPVYYDAHVDVAVREGDYVTTTRSDYDVRRDVSIRFENLPVDGSARLDDALMDSLEPFDVKDIVPFQMSYLSGFCAERFDRDSEEVRVRAEERMMSSALSVADSQVTGFTGFTHRENGLRADPMEAKYLLLPVYTFNVNWQDTKYTFAMNGQTGKVVGEVPTDKGRTALRRWGTFAAVFAVIMLLLWLVSC